MSDRFDSDTKAQAVEIVGRLLHAIVSQGYAFDETVAKNVGRIVRLAISEIDGPDATDA